MLNNNTKLKIPGDDNFVPEGFFKWFITLEKLKNDTCKKINILLEQNDFYSAKELYKEEISYNKEKVWH